MFAITKLTHTCTVHKYDKDYRINKPSQIEGAFEQIMDSQLLRRHSGVSVKVKAIVESDKPVIKEYRPHHPLADELGYIYKPNVNVMEEMANMMSASRSFQMNVQMLSTVKSMAERLLTMGQ